VSAIPAQLVRSDLPGLMVVFFVLAVLAALAGVRGDSNAGMRVAGLLTVGFLLLALFVLAG